MGYKCEIKEKEAQPVLSVRTKSAVQDLPQILGKYYGAIAQYLGELGENPAGPPFVAYYNLDMQNLDIEIGFPVTKKITDRDDIKSREIPSGKFASCLYIGPYNEIEPAYNELNRWLEEKGHESTGVAYEVYLNDPSETPPEDLRTEILFPLK
ncbi:MAG: GyrI-like domain-containing protein [Candidatus Lokiarchaeota archaeon]|nr:GyrI-like domain-containing protein [Candidatus Lokiarchaeota archaeon]